MSATYTYVARLDATDTCCARCGAERDAHKCGTCPDWAMRATIEGGKTRSAGSGDE